MTLETQNEDKGYIFWCAFTFLCGVAMTASIADLVVVNFIWSPVDLIIGVLSTFGTVWGIRRAISHL